MPQNIKAMREYIVSQGGAISFDQFMSAALYEKGLGLYQDINIGPGLETSFITFSHNQVFVEAVGRQLFQHLGPNKQILELAGGMGVFKAGILAYAKDQGIEINYLSVDISSGLSKHQLVAGGVSIQGSALTLPFAENSISGVIFIMS